MKGFNNNIETEQSMVSLNITSTVENMNYGQYVTHNTTDPWVISLGDSQEKTVLWRVTLQNGSDIYERLYTFSFGVDDEGHFIRYTNTAGEIVTDRTYGTKYTLGNVLFNESDIQMNLVYSEGTVRLSIGGSYTIDLHGQVIG